MLRGYAASKRQEATVLAAGVSPKHLYGLGELDSAIKSLRRGDVLVVASLHSLSENRQVMRHFVDQIQARGAELMDAYTGLRTDQKGVAVLDDALKRKLGEKVMPSVARARAMQEASVAKRTKGRMHVRKAVVHWRNPELTTAEALALMTGWSQGTAYTHLGVRNIPTGRRGETE